MDTRGIILTMQIRLSEGGLLSGTIESVELRKHLLYWDFIDFPTVNGNGSNIDAQPDAKLLKEQGFLLQSEVEVPSTIPRGKITAPADFKERRDMHLLGQNKVFNDYVRKNIVCSLSQYNVELEIPVSSQKQICILEMELNNCLPYPTAKTQIADILEFKEKRRDELSRLRHGLDKIYLVAAANINDLRTKSFAIDELKSAISDINKLFDENDFKKNFFSFKTLLKIAREAFEGYIVGAEAVKIFNLPISEQILGGTYGLLKAIPKQILGPKGIPPNQRDFAYLYYAQKELATITPTSVTETNT